MVKLLILADDFTGALDTGVQFAKRGVETQVFTDRKLNKDTVSKTAEVLVIDLETRPLSKEAAYQVVATVVKTAKEMGIPVIFKKTDSALRGNIGAELEAVLEASNEKKLFFIPAFPDVNRITKEGIHYIDGELLENSAFREACFDLIQGSYVPDIIKQQTDCCVEVIGTEETFPTQDSVQNTIYVFDAERTEHMKQRIREMKEAGQLTVLAGCAGLANCLAEALDLQHHHTQAYRKSDGLYMACGSLNPITREQVLKAEEKGASLIHLTLEQKLNPSFYDTKEGTEFLARLKGICEERKLVIADTFDEGDSQTTIEYAREKGLDIENVRYIISECHGRIVKELILHGLNYTILMTGGDTLMGFMNQIGCNQLHPICEMGQGAVLSQLHWEGKEVQVISKSGGYGEPEIITNILQMITMGQENDYEVCYDASGM
ncbi:four-carbon acid sugar kinase family protein [Lachnospiraceae bacterium OttesenSCG-928-E19]|nr:four-carbon acid sugar kinase family protein [Lachnospiraceae bacterium OttesenSCG-928-E19]